MIHGIGAVEVNVTQGLKRLSDWTGLVALVFLLSGCTMDNPIVQQGRGIGVITDGETPLTAIEVAVDLANREGLLAEGTLYLDIRQSSEDTSLEDTVSSLAFDERITSILSLLEGESAVEVSRLADSYAIFTVSPLGTEWWEAAQAGENQWHVGLIASTAGLFAAVGKLVSNGSLTCQSAGVILGGSPEQRTADIAVFERIAMAYGLSWRGALYPESRALDTWTTNPDCVLAERGTHAFSARLAGEFANAGEASQFVFGNLQGVEEFLGDAESINNLAGHYTLTSSNGSLNLQSVRAFEDFFRRTSLEDDTLDARLPVWYEAHFFDAAIVDAISVLVTNERDLIPPIYRVVATQDGGEDASVALRSLETTLASAVIDVEDDLVSGEITGPGADYVGATGTLDYVPDRPVPVQRYSLRKIIDYVERSFEPAVSVTATDEGTEYQ